MKIAPKQGTSVAPIKILLGLAVGIFLAALDQTVMATASPTIASSFNALHSQAWLLTAYLLPSLVTTPIYGRLSDGFGRRPLFLAALTLFLAGSLVAIFSPNMSVLLSGRIVQGLGAGGLFSLAFAVIADLLPPRERSKYVLLFVAIFGSASLLGPLIGGVIATQSKIFGVAGWRWIFIINIPITLVALILALAYLHVKQRLKREKFDWLGVFFFTIFITSLLMRSEASDSPLLLRLKSELDVVIVLALVCFFFVERRQGMTALMPLSFFRNRLFSLTLVASMVGNAGMFVGLAMIPLLMQVMHGVTPLVAGSILLPMGFGNLLGSGIGNRSISKQGKYRWIVITGMMAYAVGFLLLYINSTTAAVVIAVTAIGLGSGLVTQFTSVTAPYALGDLHRGSGSSINTFVRQFGGVLGAGLSLALLFTRWHVRGGFRLTPLNSPVIHFSSIARTSFLVAARPIFVVLSMLLALTTLLLRSLPKDEDRLISPITD
ncbi:MAG TPA: MFS transporter [Candidatus Nanopelagicaceae bacterium]